MDKIPYVIEKNEDGSFAIIENPQSNRYGSMAFAGDKVVRSPYKTEKEARKRIKEIGEHWGYDPVEIMSK